jgi:SRSO17 transposase
MERSEEFNRYMAHIGSVVGRSERRELLKGYCQGLMLPLKRKSVEPLAASIDPEHVSSKHQSLNHFVAQSPWSDEAVLTQVIGWVLPRMDLSEKSPVFWIADDSGMPKQGTHSVGVARQYCGQLGKTDNCQVAVTLSIATAKASLPVKYRLYLPESWARDPVRRRETGVPEDIVFATKPEISLAQMKAAKEAGLPGDIVLADAGYGDDTDYRDGITALGLRYAVGIKTGTKVWAQGNVPLPPAPWSGKGRKPTLLRRGPENQPVTVKELALSLPASAWRKTTWREGTNTALTSRFAAVRVRAAHGDTQASELRAEEWLLIEWPKGEPEPTKYFLSTLAAITTRKELVNVVKMRWRIERDYQELKQEFGLDNFEGRNWRGFHHHATLCIAAYGFLIGERLLHGDAVKKNGTVREKPALPQGHTPRGAGQTPTPRRGLDHDPALGDRPRTRSAAHNLPLLRAGATGKSTCLTQ